MEVIKAEQVNFSYTSPDSVSIALSGLTLGVRAGEFLCVLGANGSGKSTFARLTNALLTPTSGRMTVCGMDTAEESRVYEIRRACGMVFQNPDNQIVASVIEDDVAFGPENIGLPREEIRRRVDFAIDAVGMRDYLHRSPNMLSGGQKQRVAIAGILALAPDIIVFDEPTAMLDSAGREDVLSTVLKMNREMGKTVVLITHNMEEAALADRIVVMNAGHAVMEGTPKEVFSREKELKEYGLDVPIPTKIYNALSEFTGGGDVPLTAEQTAEELCRLLQRT